MECIIFILVLFGNLWIWKILFQNPAIGIFLLIMTFLLYVLPKTKEVYFYKLFAIVFTLILFFQWKTTDPQSLTNISNDQKRVQDMRLREYPPVKISLLGKDVWIPVAHWFEGKRESIAFFRILKNFSEVVDPNLYFFANHPRQRIGIKEFEMFPFISLPFFVLGSFLVFEKNKKLRMFLIIILPVALLSFIGNQNKLGPFSLFPFFISMTTAGFNKIFIFLKKLKTKKGNLLGFGIVTMFILVLIQIYSYEFL